MKNSNNSNNASNNNSNKGNAMKTVNNMNEISSLNVNTKHSAKDPKSVAKATEKFKENQRKQAEEYERAINAKKAKEPEVEEETSNKGKVMKVSVIRRTKEEVAVRKELECFEKAAKQPTRALMLEEVAVKEPADTGWYGVKSQDLSTTFFTEVDWDYCNAQFLGLDSNGDLTANQYFIEKEETFKHAPSFLLKVGKEEFRKAKYEGATASDEALMVLAEQLLEEQDKSYGFNKKSNSGEVTLRLQKSFVNENDETIWYNLTESDLGLGTTHKKNNRRIPARIPFFGSSDSGLDGLFMNVGNTEVINSIAVEKAVEGLFYVTERQFRDVVLGEEFRAVIDHPEIYRLVGFASEVNDNGFAVLEYGEIEEGIVGICPDNRYIADRNSAADISMRESNEEIIYGRSADKITRHAEDVANAFSQRILEKAEEYNLEKIAKRASIGAEVHNEKINAILEVFPKALTSIKTMNNMFADGAISKLVAYVSALNEDELQAVFNMARASKSDENRLTMESRNFRSPYFLVKNKLGNKRQEERKLKKDFVDPAIAAIIDIINSDESLAIETINKNKALAPKITVAAEAGVRIKNPAFFSAVKSMTTLEEIKKEREALNRLVA